MFSIPILASDNAAVRSRVENTALESSSISVNRRAFRCYYAGFFNPGVCGAVNHEGDESPAEIVLHNSYALSMPSSHVTPLPTTASMATMSTSSFSGGGTSVGDQESSPSVVHAATGN